MHPRDWALPAVIALVLFGLMLGGEPVAAALRYERGAVLSGEVWRVLTAHLVHADWTHLAWNVGGLVLVFALFAGAYSRRDWLIVMLTSTVAIDLGFLLLEPGLAWYVGLSGVLHGVMAAGLVAWLRAWRDPLSIGVAALFVGKLVWEHLRGALPFTAESLAVPVIHEAHSYGAIGGLLCALVLLARRGRAAAPL
jgi:rhomboid family GlyGly-CTERM serine protease